MPKIVVKRKDEFYKELTIGPTQDSITVGSDGDNDLIIADKKVSLHHLVIEKEGTHYFIDVLDSTFGTSLNGKKIKQKSRLITGDEIIIGEHSLIFEDELSERRTRKRKKKTTKEENVPNDRTPATPGKNAKPEETVKKEMPRDEMEVDITEVISAIPDSETPTSSLPASADTNRAETKKTAVHYLLAIYGPYTGKKYRLNFGTTKIGRDQTLNDIVIRETAKGEIDTSISRRHATILFENDNFYIMDKRSKTRTRVNQRELGEEDMLELAPNDEIEIVSDKKSTIFRFVPEGKENFSRPHKSGDWWVRNGLRTGRALSLLLGIVLILVMAYSWNMLTLFNQKPDILTLTEKPFWTSQNSEPVSFQPDEIIANLSALAPSIADLNGDKFLDVVFLDKNGYLHVINGKTRKSLWAINTRYRSQLPTGIVLADLNGNRLPDIVIAAHNSIIYALDGNYGTEIWASPVLGGIFSGSPVIADINGDHLPDVFICNQSGKVHIGRGTYQEPQWSHLQISDTIKCAPSAGDIDFDGLPEIIVGTENGKVFIYDGTSNQFTHTLDINDIFMKAKKTFFENHPIRQRIAVGKLNDDLFDDLIILTEKNHVLVWDVNQQKSLWFAEIKTDSSIATLTPPTLGDVNGDGQLEAVIATRDNRLLVYNGWGRGANQAEIIWQYTPQNGDRFVSLPVLTDINKDGTADVLIADYYGGVKIFSEQEGKLFNYQIPLSRDGSVVIGTPLLGDVNDDSFLDILLRKNESDFALLQTNSRVKPASVLWGQMNFNSLQAGCLPMAQDMRLAYYLMLSISAVILVSLLFTNMWTILRRKKLIRINRKN